MQAQVQGLGEYVRMGFTLEHDGAMAVFLLHQNKLVARFSQLGATPKILLAGSIRHLAISHYWDGCLWAGKEASGV